MNQFWYYVNPLTWFGWILQFIQLWVTSFAWRGLAPAVPALIVLALMVVGTTLAWSSSTEWRNRLVDRQLAAADAAENYDVVQLLLRRRLRSDPDNKALQFQLAQTYEKLELDEQSADLYRTQAFEEKNGRAALWLLENEFQVKDAAGWSSEKMEEFGTLAAIAVDEFPRSPELRNLYASYLLQKQELDQAIQQLRQCQKLFEDRQESMPALGFQIALLLKTQAKRATQQGATQQSKNYDDQATAAATKAAGQFAKFVDEQPENPVLRVSQARVLIFLERYEEAIRTLADGYKRSKDERLRGAIGEAIIVYSGSLGDGDQSVGALRTRLKMLQQAVGFAPSNPAVLKAIADTILSTINEDDAQVAALRENLINGTAPSIGHFIRGTVAMMQGDADLASIELRLAAKEMPQSAAILNNLAVAKTSLAKENENNPEDLKEALSLADKALELSAETPSLQTQIPYFRETRGQILLAMGRFEEAIPDIDAALQVDALKEQALRALAEAYRGLGQDERAAEYLTAADRFKQRKLAADAEQKGALESFSEMLKSENAAENVLGEADATATSEPNPPAANDGDGS
jgi:predicted Zn-dependent protease